MKQGAAGAAGEEAQKNLFYHIKKKISTKKTGSR
jgi:hypothetical protein